MDLVQFTIAQLNCVLVQAIAAAVHWAQACVTLEERTLWTLQAMSAPTTLVPALLLTYAVPCLILGIVCKVCITFMSIEM